jgi:hypothetical protein
MAATPMVTGLFRDRESAERASRAVAERGYAEQDVHLVMSNEARQRHFGDRLETGAGESELETKAAEGAGIGGALGGTLGAIAAAVAAVGTTVAVPGLGIVLAGPAAAALAGAGAGAATGGVLGALVGWNIPEERARHYESGIREGGILMGVRPRSAEDAAHLETIWRTHGGEEVYR